MTNDVVLASIAILRALVELAGLFLLAQGALYVLAGSGRETNGIYRLLRLLASPAVRLMRLLMPKRIIDRHIPFLAFFALLWLWIALAYLRQAL